MNQPWQPQPQQPQPYGQQPPGPPPPGYGYPGPPQPPVQQPTQQPMQPGYAYPQPQGGYPQGGYPQGGFQPGFPPPASGNPAKAFFLGLLLSVMGALVFGGILVASYEDLSKTGLKLAYGVFALVIGVAVGAVAGKAGGKSPATFLFAALLAMAATFFGYTNGVVFILLDAANSDVVADMLEDKPFFPAESWWEGNLEEAVALLGLALAAGAACGAAAATSKRRL
ncbi:hypothetical protein ACX6XY_05120 [Streptomyces sp. O3]